MVSGCLSWNFSHSRGLISSMDFFQSLEKVFRVVLPADGHHDDCGLTFRCQPEWMLPTRNSDGNPDSPQVVVFLATIVDVTVGS